MDETLLKQLQLAKNASRAMMNIGTKTKNIALEKISQALLTHIPEIIQAESKDLTKPKKII